MKTTIFGFEKGPPRYTFPMFFKWAITKTPGGGLTIEKGKRQMTEVNIAPRISYSDEGGTGAAATVKTDSMATETAEALSLDMPKITNANKWTVAEVCDFIRIIPFCASYADEFLMQVDGEALLLIKPEPLVMALSMKLGPALKIVACIDSLRPESEQQTDQ